MLLACGADALGRGCVLDTRHLGSPAPATGGVSGSCCSLAVMGTLVPSFYAFADVSLCVGAYA
jgi:hypothetical protein